MRVNRRFNRMSPGLEGVSYEERLNKLGLFSLERQRSRGNMIEVYKLMRGIDQVDRNRKGAVTLVGVFYRLLNSNRDVEEEIARQIMDRCGGHRVAVVGDFNFPNIDWNLYRSNSFDGAVFVQCVQEGFLTKYVDRATSDGAILDLVLGNEPGQVLDLFVGEHFGDSDHNSVSFTIAMEKECAIRQGKVYNWGRGNYDAIRQELGSIRWVQKLSGKGSNEKWSFLKEQILHVLDRYFPVGQGGNGRVREPWFTKEVECLVKRKKEAYVRMRKQGSVGLLEGYKVARNELKKRA